MRNISTLVILLVLLVSVLGGGCSEFNTGLRTNIIGNYRFSTSQSSSNLTIQWNSSDNSHLSELTDDLKIIADGISFFTSFNDTGNNTKLKIANITSTMRWDVYEDHSVSLGNTSQYKIPWLSYNYTGDFSVEVTTNNGTIYYNELENITVENTFSPQILSLHVVEEGVIKNVTWTIYDGNMDDVFLTDVFLSADDGTTYQRIATNVSTTYFEWNSAGFTLTDYVFMIRVRDSRGLTAEANYRPYWHNGVPTPVPPIISHPNDIEIVFGELVVEIEWELITEYTVSYTIRRNDTTVQTGSSSGGVITQSLDNLSPGVYAFTIQMGYVDTIISDTVIVRVLTSYSSIILALVIGVGSGAAIVLIIYMVSKRNRRV
ncbi:MAG: hypothetical protein ACFFF4_02750 [Candidatus Thorarchaeota archaeon]